MVPDESDLYNAIQQTFQENREVYGARKLKKALEKKQIFVSRRKITRIMKELGLESAYSDKKFKVSSKSGTGVRTKTWTPPGLRKELKNVFEEAG